MCVCVCEREREREREYTHTHIYSQTHMNLRAMHGLHEHGGQPANEELRDIRADS